MIIDDQSSYIVNQKQDFKKFLTPWILRRSFDIQWILETLKQKFAFFFVNTILVDLEYINYSNELIYKIVVI